ncbi:MAG: inorganic phosphate transporter [Lentisphaerae bacterium GWF2_52_8]|nr:MAG: inorganic phosphate transporter [Lentisphaerae bacterium GWF2_52_8]
MTPFILVLVAALAFEYINGFHDAANSIATVVSTKVLTPRQAIMLAAVCDLCGALLGTAVASTIGKGIIDTEVVTMSTVLAALLAAIAWNLFTWWLGLPSSSSHALVGGLCGAALATTGKWTVLHWATGLWPKVVLPMIMSPVFGFMLGAILMLLIVMGFFWMRPKVAGHLFGKLQVLSASLMALSHGTNDAQKTMGIIALALFTGTSSGAFKDLPDWLGFLNMPEFTIPKWVIVLCAITMALGTAGGGWRIIRTMGHKMVRLQPVHGFAAETTASIIIQCASHLGIPVSTTHVISTSIMGVGTIKRFSAVKWGIVGKIVWAWVLTIPVTGLLGYLFLKLIG